MKTSVEVLDYYDEEVTQLIVDKYNYAPMDALRLFLFSQTYQMLSDAELELWEFGPAGIFDMWESEKITGDPRASAYIRRD